MAAAALLCFTVSFVAILLPNQGAAKDRHAAKKRIEIVMRHDEGGNHSFAASLTGVERNEIWDPTTLRLRQYPCSGKYSLRLRVFIGRHLRRVIKYVTVLNGALVEGSTFYCDAKDQTGDDASGTEDEDEAEARRHLRLSLDRTEQARNIAIFDGDRDPSTGNFIGGMELGRAPCPGEFSFSLVSLWDDGTHPKSLVYSIELLRPRINGLPVGCEHGQVYMTPL